MSDHHTQDQQDNLVAARLLLERLNVAAEDLVAAPAIRPAIPTFAEYVPVVRATMSPRTTSYVTYTTYWNKLLDYGWSERRIDEPTVAEFKTLVEHMRVTRAIRRSDRGGRAVVLHSITAFRYLYGFAVKDGFIHPNDDPAAKLDKPPPVLSQRRALPEQLLRWMIEVTDSTGNDPELDSLILRLHIETACRIAGALALRLEDLDPIQCLVQLHEKGGTTRWQPVSPSLMAELLHHGTERGAVRGERLLRFRNGKPITGRRYSYLFDRLGEHIPAVRAHGVTAHWIRHTTLRFVERKYGTAVAKAYGGHKDYHRDANDIYTRATIEEVAEALSFITGEPHPLTDAGHVFWQEPQRFSFGQAGIDSPPSPPPALPWRDQEGAAK